MKFAEVQPAPRGNVAVHCGGPGSLSDCVYLMGSEAFLGSSAGKLWIVASILDVCLLFLGSKSCCIGISIHYASCRDLQCHQF